MSADKLKIFMISPEFTPIAKSGGLGDMVGALSRSLKLLGHDVRAVLPLYGFIGKTPLTKFPSPLGVPLGFGEEWAAVYEGILPDSGIPVYYIDHEALFGSRAGIYGPRPDSSYNDNDRRFTFFCRAAFQLCKMLDWQPDIMHAHDWAAALVPLYLYTWEKAGFFAGTASVYTIHNLAYQGWFPKESIVYTQLDWSEYYDSGLERFDQLNFMQSGIAKSDILTTVSPTYAHEIKTAEYGCGLDGWLRRRQSDLFGILNGIDYDEWNSRTDPYIAPFNYDADTLDIKTEFKKQFQKTVGLPVNAGTPLIGMVSRFASQKGIEELAMPGSGALPRMAARLDAQFVIMGTGERWCEAEMRRLEEIFPNIKVFITFSNEIAHKIEAASDFFLMPSRYEPCGLNQMYSLHYGTLPIVRRTGGLNDTVTNADGAGDGTGFMLDYLSPDSLFDTVSWAVWTFLHKPEAIAAMRRRGMQQNFGWEKSAEAYVHIYKEAQKRRKNRYFRSW
jgi:starch synthase